MRQKLPIQLNMLQINLEMHLSGSKTESKLNTINFLNDRKVSGSFYKTPILTFLSLLSVNPIWGATPKWPLAVCCLTRELWCFQGSWDSPDLTLKMHSVSSSREYLFQVCISPRFGRAGGLEEKEIVTKSLHSTFQGAWMKTQQLPHIPHPSKEQKKPNGRIMYQASNSILILWKWHQKTTCEKHSGISLTSSTYQYVPAPKHGNFL